MPASRKLSHCLREVRDREADHGRGREVLLARILLAGRVSICDELTGCGVTTPSAAATWSGNRAGSCSESTSAAVAFTVRRHTRRSKVGDA